MNFSNRRWITNEEIALERSISMDFGAAAAAAAFGTFTWLVGSLSSAVFFICAFVNFALSFYKLGKLLREFRQ